MSTQLSIGALIFPGVTQLDFTGPLQFLNLIPGVNVELLWKDTNPVATDSGFSINPTMTHEQATNFDVIVLPGGPGQRAILNDDSYIQFVHKQGLAARYIMGVCTGSLTMARAGLLQGYKAGCHWAFTEQLAQFGCEFVDERIVVDRNRITGGGVTAGMDIALQLIAEVAGESVAKTIQLAVEYEPAPPFHAGRPELAGPVLEAKVRSMFGNSDLFNFEDNNQ